MDPRGKLSALAQYRLRDSVDHFTFKINGKNLRDKKDCPPFFISDKSGAIFFADDNGHCTECVSTSSRISLLRFHEGRDLLLVLTDDLLFSHYLLNPEGKLTLDTAWPQMKLGGGGGMGTNDKNSLSSLWIEPNMLAYSINMGPVRVWDSENEETYVLSRPEMALTGYKSMTFSKRNDLLAVATDAGFIIMWSRFINGSSVNWEVRV